VSVSEQGRPTAAGVRVADVLLTAVWFGLLTGFVEVLLRWTIQKKLFHIWLFYGPHFVWMAPLAEALLFALATALFLVGARMRPGPTTARAAFFVPAFFCFLTLALMLPGLHPFAALLVAAGLALHVSRFLAARAPRFLRLVHSSVGWGIAVVVFLAAGIFGWQALAERRAVAKLPPTPAGAPNVLLLVLDTVRAENLSAYGYERPTTPRLAQLAQTGVRFDHVISTASWTSPAHMTMMTGQFPHELIEHWKDPMGPGDPTLAEVLGGRGYVSGGFVANIEYAGHESGISRGFIHFEDYPVSLAELALSSSLAQAVVNNQTLRNLIGEHQILGRKMASDVNDDFLSWLSRQDGRRPFFAFLNFFDAHEIYLPPHPFDDEFGSEAERDESGIWHFKRRAKLPHKKDATAAQIQAELDSYDGSIAYLDHELGRLFDELQRRGVLDNTIVIVTADHGEQFGEHGKFEHGNSLYRQLVEIPLIIRFPKRVPGGTTVPTPVSLRDLAATVLDLAGAEPSGIGGGSLAPLWSGAPLEGDRTLLSEWSGGSLTALPPVSHPGLLARSMAFVRQKLGIETGGKREIMVRTKSLVDDGFHYVRNGDGTEELYDFASDPKEEHDLARSREGAERLARFRSSLQEIVARGATPADGSASAADLSSAAVGQP
jgi:arylsulfatase A-like enzyme